MNPRLNYVDYEGGFGPPLLIAHGLYGSARNWGAIAKRLSADRPVRVVDMRNHAGSPWFDTHTYGDMATDLAQVMPEGASLLGHSMGGKAAMTLALSVPGLIDRLIVADIAPVAYTHDPGDILDAIATVDLTGVERRSDADAALKGVVTDPSVRAFVLQSLDVKERRWRLNIDVLRQEMPNIIGFPDADGAFEGSTLFLSGGQSTYVLPQHRDRINLVMNPIGDFEDSPEFRSLAVLFVGIQLLFR